MDEKSYKKYVSGLGAFRRALRPMVKGLIFGVGLLIGVVVWVTGFAQSFPFIVLMFLGTGTAATVVKVLLILVTIVSLIVIPLVAWAVYLIAYVISSMVIMFNESASMGDIIFEDDSK